ncbi:MAG TPA: hypothetical protein VJZ76_00580 [Thermoanaerobaculia bacterium]|nr:hypothetical protein [Thermoanaerobaculia bacterium]
MKVAFLTVFLGLVAGRQPVEVTVTGDAARVEFVLDHHVVASVTKAPWRAVIDFGSSPLPHRLEARVFAAGAKDADAEAVQKVNAVAPPQHLNLIFDHGRARVIWLSVDQTKPDKIEARFDGAPVNVNRDLTIPLPSSAADRAHLLEVSARGGKEEYDAQLIVGAAFESTAAAEMTAIPVRVTSAARPEDIACTVEGSRVPAVALDDLPAEVILVRDRAAGEISTKLEAGTGVRRNTTDNVQRVERYDEGSARGDQSVPGLAKSDRVRFLWSSPRTGQGNVAAMLFDASHSFSTMEGTTFPTLLSRVSAPEEGTAAVRYADAVAVAGLRASQSQRPRAVVLILGGAAAMDASQMRPAGAIAYLRSLGVPLYVWTLGEPATLPVASAWGPAVDISSRSKLDSAILALRRDIDAQRILWIKGDYLAREVDIRGSGVEMMATP